MISGLLSVPFCEVVCLFLKKNNNENIVIYILIHTIQLIFSIKKLHLFFVVLPNLQVGELKHCPMLLMLD